MEKLENPQDVYRETMALLTSSECDFSAKYLALLSIEEIDEADIKIMTDLLYKQDSRIREVAIDLIYGCTQRSVHFMYEEDSFVKILNTLQDKNPKVCRITVKLLTQLDPVLQRRVMRFLLNKLTCKKLSDDKVYWILLGFHAVMDEGLYSEEELLKDFMDRLGKEIYRKNYVVREVVGLCLSQMMEENLLPAGFHSRVLHLLGKLSTDHNFYVKTIAQKALQKRGSKNIE